MQKYLEKTGKTPDDAVAAALAELGMDRDDVSVEILEFGKSGFLGIGASPAVVRVSYEAPDEPEAAPAVAAPAAEEKAPAAQEAPKSAPAVTDENPDYAAIRAFLSGLLERMNVKADIEISPRDNGGVNVNLSGSGSFKQSFNEPDDYHYEIFSPDEENTARYSVLIRVIVFPKAENSSP